MAASGRLGLGGGGGGGGSFTTSVKLISDVPRCHCISWPSVKVLLSVLTIINCKLLRPLIEVSCRSSFIINYRTPKKSSMW